MRKVLFKGIINGEQFDNVADYNKKMMELIAKGDSVEASSSTQIVDTDVDSENNTELANGEPDLKDDVEKNPKVDMRYYIPFEIKDIDDLLDPTNMDDEHESMLEGLQDYIDDLFDEFSGKVEKINTQELLDFAKRVKEIVRDLEKSSKENDVVIDKLKTRIADDTNKLEQVNRADEVIDTLLNYYDNVYQLAKAELLK